MFRIYDIDIIFNETQFNEAWIDPHYEEKHKGSINDKLILMLLNCIHETLHLPQKEGNNGFKYYELDIEQDYKLYRLILVIPPNKSYIGIRNAYRKKYDEA
ncbi:MAG: hypothetical protein V4596_12585 [Bdellovibrionota bacterium]